MKIASVSIEPLKIIESEKEAITEFHKIVNSFSGRILHTSTLSDMSYQIACFVYRLHELGFITEGIPNIEVRQDSPMYLSSNVAKVSFDGRDPIDWLCRAMDYDPSLSNAERFILNIAE